MQRRSAARDRASGARRSSRPCREVRRARVRQRRRHRQPRSRPPPSPPSPSSPPGSGFYAPTLFDAYSAFRLRPAAMFALPVVRKPAPAIATALGGGYLASGPRRAEPRSRPRTSRRACGSTASRARARCRRRCSATGGRALQVGDRVYFRHAKAGELCERFDSPLPGRRATRSSTRCRPTAARAAASSRTLPGSATAPTGPSTRSVYSFWNDAARVEPRPHRLEAVPLGIARRERRGRLEVALAPVRAAAVVVHDRLDRAEVRLPRHARGTCAPRCSRCRARARC